MSEEVQFEVENVYSKDEKVFGDEATFLSVTAFMLIGLLMIWAGLNYLNSFWNFMEVEDGAYDVTKSIISAFVLVFSIHMFSRNLVTEGIVVMFTGISSLSFSLGALLLNVQGYEVLDILFSIGIYIAAILFIGRKNYLLGLASLSFAVSISFAYAIKTDGLNVLVGAGLMISGLFFAYYSFGNLILGETGKNILHVTQNSRPVGVEEDRDRSFELVIVAGMYTFATLTLLVGYEFLFVDYTSVPYCVAEFFLSLAVMAFALYALVRGMIPEGIMMLMFGLSCFIFATVVIFGFVPSSLIDIITSLVLGITGAAFLLRKEVMLSVISLLFLIGGILEAVFEMYFLGGVFISIMGILAMYYAVSRWVLMEAGKEFLLIR
ncbi:MAG: hypothetical protein KRP56_02385 [Candidatus Methanogranum gryphiswaldense]|nr:MAG: hypothetical protein KRP56_02385 [Candidatus Methanogranum sp. U3.2.1]